MCDGSELRERPLSLVRTFLDLSLRHVGPNYGLSPLMNMSHVEVFRVLFESQAVRPFQV
jgi:hypothetical protein